MNVTVFGATGGIGRHVVRQLLAEGHQVTAYVRSPDKLVGPHPQLTARTGELTDVGEVHAAVRGSDAVISAVGPPLTPFSRGTPLTDGTRTVLAAMRDERVDRFVGLATPSIPDPRDGRHWKRTVLPVVAGLFMPNALREIRGMSALIAESGFDWTIARITNPVSRPGTGTVRAGFLGRDPVGSVVSREDVATFLVDQLTDTTYHRSAPAISN